MQALQKIPLLQGLTPEELDGLGQIAVQRTFPAAHTVFWQEDPADALYILTRGWVKVYGTTTDGKEKIFQVFGSGEFFGELALLDGQPRSATVETLDECEMVLIHRDAFKDYLLKHPEVLWKMYQVVCEKLRRLSNEMLDLSYRDARHRFLQVLLFLSEKYGKTNGAGCEIGIRLTHRDLANMVGSNRETITRLVAKLEGDGLITMGRSRMTILNLAALRQAVE